MGIKLLVGGFFPRQHPTREEYVDEGWCSTDTCPKCGHEEYGWVSMEFCPACGAFTDYWSTGDPSVEQHFKKYGVARLKRDYLEAAAARCLEHLGLKPEHYTLIIHHEKR